MTSDVNVFLAGEESTRIITNEHEQPTTLISRYRDQRVLFWLEYICVLRTQTNEKERNIKSNLKRRIIFVISNDNSIFM